MRGRAISYVVKVSIVAAIAALTLPSYRVMVLIAWTLAVLGAGLLVSNAAIFRLIQGRSSFEAALRPRPRTPERPADLVKCERAFGWKIYGAKDFDHHVRPQLREMIRHRLRMRGTGATLSPLPQSLEQILGARPAEDIYETNLTTADISLIVAQIEVL